MVSNLSFDNAFLLIIWKLFSGASIVCEDTHLNCNIGSLDGLFGFAFYTLCIDEYK